MTVLASTCMVKAKTNLKYQEVSPEDAVDNVSYETEYTERIP